MYWKAGRVHGITTVAQLPLGAAEQTPCILPSTCNTNSRAFRAAHSPPTPLSDAFPLREGYGAHYAAMDTRGEIMVL